MPRLRPVVETPVRRTARVLQVEGLFDVPPAERREKTWDLTVDLDAQPWQVGLIVGPSGAAKTTVARALFGTDWERPLEWDPTAAVVDNFPETLGIREIVGWLTAVGFGSAPHWLQPFHTLSTGEQFRVSVARQLAETDLAIVDEFTSVVDRQVAQVASHAIQKAVRRTTKRLVALSCHYDVLDWLQPDWVLQPHLGTFDWRHLQRRPPITLAIHAVDRAAWTLFRHHHYLSGRLQPNARCFGAWLGEELVAFNAVTPFPHATTHTVMMGHRLVVLPDYQGLGIGGRFDEWLGEYLYQHGYRNVVAHPAMIATYRRSPRWREMSSVPRSSRSASAALRRRHYVGSGRGTHSFEYVPIERGWRP